MKIWLLHELYNNREDLVGCYTSKPAAMRALFANAAHLKKYRHDFEGWNLEEKPVLDETGDVVYWTMTPEYIDKEDV